MNRSHCPLVLLLIPIALVCFALSSTARAVCRQGCGSGDDNTFFGEDALLTDTGTDNTAIGFEALLNNTGDINTAIGSQALHNNTTGNTSTAVGVIALFTNTTGFANNAIGWESLYNNTTGYQNVANGVGTLFGNTTGNNNVAVGSFAGSNLSTGSNNIYIGNVGGGAAESAKIRIGTVGTQNGTFIAGISGAIVPGGVGVIVGANGKLGTVVSSERFKDAVKPMDKASEAILALKPVTFRYKQELDPVGIPQFGLVAEDVEKVNPDLVARDDEGKPYTVRYDAVNAMLLNEFLKEHGKVQKLEATVAQQHKDFEAAVTELKRQIQKVSAQIELSKPAPRTVLNP